MKPPNHHYSKYLISVHFDTRNDIMRMSDYLECCADFLYDLGELAILDGKRLHATYSLVSAGNDFHAHFATNYMPTSRTENKTKQNSKNRIKKTSVVNLLESHGFIVDNRIEAIKPITHDKKYVTDYVLFQPKIGQSVYFTAFYIHDEIELNHSRTLSELYSSNLFFDEIKITLEILPKYMIEMILILSIISLLMISGIIGSIS